MTFDITGMYSGPYFLWWVIPIIAAVIVLLGFIGLAFAEREPETAGVGLMVAVLGGGGVALLGVFFGAITVSSDQNNAVAASLERLDRYTSVDAVEDERSTYIGIRPDGKAEKFFLRDEENDVYRILPIE